MNNYKTILAELHILRLHKNTQNMAVPVHKTNRSIDGSKSVPGWFFFQE